MFACCKNISSFEMSEGINSKILANNKVLMIVENTFKQGAVAPNHSHENEQVGYILSGKFNVSVNEESRILGPGDSFAVHGNIQHSCTAIESGVILDIFTPMREDLVKLETFMNKQ